MATLLAPVAKAPTYVKVGNFPGLYRHARSGRYYACKKLGGIRRERNLRHLRPQDRRAQDGGMARQIGQGGCRGGEDYPWQGHQGGGQLILDTYTQVFGSDDEEYVRGQLAKLGGTKPVGVASGPLVDGSTPVSVKGPSNHDAHSDRHSAPVGHPAPAAMNYPQFTGVDGRHYIKQRFQPSAAMPPLWYPPKWGINERCEVLPWEGN